MNRDFYDLSEIENVYVCGVSHNWAYTVPQKKMCIKWILTNKILGVHLAICINLVSVQQLQKSKTKDTI